MIGIGYKYPATVVQVHQVITFKIKLYIIYPNILTIPENNGFIAVAPEVIIGIEAHIADGEGIGYIAENHTVLRIKGWEHI